MTKLGGFFSPFIQHTAKERCYFSNLLCIYFCADKTLLVRGVKDRGPHMIAVVSKGYIPAQLTPLSLHTDITMYKLLSNDRTISVRGKGSHLQVFVLLYKRHPLRQMVGFTLLLLLLSACRLRQTTLHHSVFVAYFQGHILKCGT